MAVCETQTAYIREFINLYLDGVNYDGNLFLVSIFSFYIFYYYSLCVVFLFWGGVLQLILLEVGLAQNRKLPVGLDILRSEGQHALLLTYYTGVAPNRK